MTYGHSVDFIGHFKMSIGTCRWGDLTEEDNLEIVTMLRFLKVFPSNVLRRGPFTDSLTTSVE